MTGNLILLYVLNTLTLGFPGFSVNFVILMRENERNNFGEFTFLVCNYMEWGSGRYSFKNRVIEQGEKLRKEEV